MQTLRTKAGMGRLGRLCLAWMAGVVGLTLGAGHLAAQSSYLFSIPTYSVYEGTAPMPTNVTVIVLRTGDVSTPGSVTYSTADRPPGINSATSGGIDYTTAAGTLNFAPGELFKTFNVFITADNAAEYAEFLDLTLSNPVGGVLGSVDMAEIVIFDDDDCFSFTQAIYVVDEDATNVMVTICRTLTNAGPSVGSPGTELEFAL